MPRNFYTFTGFNSFLNKLLNAENFKHPKYFISYRDIKLNKNLIKLID